MSKKSIATIFYSIAIVVMLVLFSPSIKANEYSNIAKGVDIGWLTQLEKQGITWINDYGVQKDPLEILKEFGVDSVRLRVFVNPPTDGIWYKNGEKVELGECDKNSVVALAKRARDMGFKIMIDFHYSDHFADPGTQDVPEAWKDHSWQQLKDDIYNHTYDVMSALANEGIYPEWVQVGNELNTGMLWPEGYIWHNGRDYADTTKLSQFINSGYDAIKSISPNSKVIVHVSTGVNNVAYRKIFDSLTANNTNYDIIGMTYYPYWDGVNNYQDNIKSLEYNLNDMATRYNKEVMICEVGGKAYESADSYNLVKTVMDKVAAVPNSKGTGVFYWEACTAPTVIAGEYPLGACIEVAPKVLKFNDALNGFKEQPQFPNTSTKYKIVNRLSGKTLNVKNGSNYDGAWLEQQDYYGWDSQKWYVSEVDGHYIIRNVKSNKVLDILERSQYDGAYCVQWQNNYGWNQEWKFEKTWDDYYKIINRNSGKLLDVNASSYDNGAQVIQWSDRDGWNQEWLFIEVE